jgi:hypothetical protein
MTVSAPLQKSLIEPLGVRTIVDIRLRVELNSHTLRISYSAGTLLIERKTERGLRVCGRVSKQCD